MSKLEDTISAALEKRKRALALQALPDGEVPYDSPIITEGAEHKGPVHTIPTWIQNDPLFLMGGEQNRAAAEQFGILKESLIKSTRGASFKNTLMVTSSLANEGKSIISINLAISLAREYDYTVLLIDADLRKPSVASFLDIKGGAGLTECLTGKTTLSEAIVKTDIGKLRILPAGAPASNPVELISSKRMTELLSEMKHRYSDRYIIIDTPPVIPFAETRILAHNVDGIIYIIKEGGSSLVQVEKGLETLEKSKIIGLVYNQAAGFTGASQYGMNSYY